MLKPFVIAGSNIPGQVLNAIRRFRETEPHDGAGRVPHQVEHEPLHYTHVRIEFRDDAREYAIWNRHLHALYGLQSPYIPPDIHKKLELADAIESSCKPPQTPLYDLSLSYAGSDLHLADSITHLLSQTDIKVFWDHGGRTNPALASPTKLIYGLIWPLIVGSRALCIIGTRDALGSHWVHLEMSGAVSARRPIFGWLPRDETFKYSQERPDVPAQLLKANADLLGSDGFVAHCEQPRTAISAAAGSIAAFARIVRDMAAQELDTDPLSVRRHLEHLQRMENS